MSFGSPISTWYHGFGGGREPKYSILEFSTSTSVIKFKANFREFVCGRAEARHLQGAEEFVEFVGGVEVGFELAGGKFFAEVVEAAGEEVE
jgi:hypothetical protein